MKKTTNGNVRVRIRIPAGCEELVKQVDLAAKARGMTRAELCSDLLNRAASRLFVEDRGVISHGRAKGKANGKNS